MSSAAVRSCSGSVSCCLASMYHQSQEGLLGQAPSVSFVSGTFWQESSRHIPRNAGGGFPEDVPTRSLGDMRCRAMRGTKKSMIEQPDTVDWDHMDENELDDLWDKHGDTVLSNPDVLALEDLDDTDSKEFAVAMAEIADFTKAVDVRVLHVAPFVFWTRVMVLVTAFSRPQVNAIGSRIREAALEKFQRTPDNDSDDGTPKSWTIVDFGDVVIHVFLPKEREYYGLDEYYKEAESISLPFANRGLE